METIASGSARIDPRTARSTAALRAAVLRLAESQQPSSILVTDLVKAAGVSRKTFYNHSTTPGELLADVLTEELDRARDTAEEQFPMTSADLSGAVRHRLRAILQQVHDRRSVYLPDAQGSVPPELYQLLSDHFAVAVRDSINASHRVVPRLPGFDDAAHRFAALDLYSSYIAHAYAGAIQAWLRHPETGEVDFLLDLILAALPGWMTDRA